MASCSASASLESIPGVAFQAISPLVLRYRMASPEFPKNLGDQLGSGVACGVIFDALIFDINPEPKNLGHAEFHYVPSIAARFC
jgi:hypothetical protein